MRRGFFITFEGLDGSGKTTQLRQLAASLESRGERVTVTRQPGGTHFGDCLRSLLLDPAGGSIAPRAEMALMFADRAQSIAEIIEPALERGEIVVCDRFTDSTEAYQGGGRELGSEIVLAMHQAVCGGLKPDLTLLLLPDLAASLARARHRNQRSVRRQGKDEGRFEGEPDAFYQRVFSSYQAIALREPLRVVTIDGDQTIEQIHSTIVKTAVARLLEHHNG